MGSWMWESQSCASSCLRRLSRCGYRDRRGVPSRPGAPSPALTSLAGRGSWLFTHVARRLEYVSARMLTEYQWRVQIASHYVAGACPDCWTACVHVVASTQSRLFANDWYRRLLAGLAIRCARSLRYTAHTMLVVDVYRQRAVVHERSSRRWSIRNCSSDSSRRVALHGVRALGLRFGIQKMSVVSRAQSDQAQSDQGGRCCQERRSSMLPRRHSLVLMPCGLSSWHRLSIIGL